MCRTSCRIRGSELFRALSDSIDVIHERVRRKPTVAMVVTYNRAMSAMMPIIPGPSRMVREVDIMEDESVWAILDEGCNMLQHYMSLTTVERKCRSEVPGSWIRCVEI